MAKRRSGRAAFPPTSVETPEMNQTFKLLLDQSDDEAPEEVTFEDSKAEALSSMKRALECARREKELLRERRRRRQELFQEQKKRKLLPADVLDEMESAPSKKQSDDEDAEEDEDAGSEAGNRKLVHVRTLKGNYTVTTAREQETASFQRQAAEDFIRSRLYGPGSCRTTSNELLSLQNKKGTNKRAAVQFVKKNWASKEKAKAEKMKKRWIHQQQLPSS
ncbi:U3 small nucleolar RNA-associated protein NOL7 [Xenentodon cancila]